jgi:Tol biopolymer transport system component
VFAGITNAPNSARPAILFVRSLSTFEPRPLPGTEDAFFPFWSPDSRYIGFFKGGKLMKVDVNGGPPVTLCEVSGLYRGGTWNRNNVIVFVTAGTGSIHRVDAGGGTPTPVIPLDKDELAQGSPWFLPDGRHLLYLSARGPNVELRVASLDSTETTSLGNSESNAMYDSGHLLFVRGGTLMARPFNPDTQQPTGDAFPLAEDVSLVGVRGIFSTSTTGVLSYWRAGGQAISRLVWADRTGKTLGQVGEPASYSNFSLSPDGRRVAVAMTAGTPINRDIWVIDLARQDTASRLTFDAGREGDPVWSPDGSQIVFNSDRSGNWNTGYVRPSDGSGQDAPLVTMERLFDSPDWSRDGRFIVFTGGAHQSSNDLWMLPMSGDRKPEPFLQTPFSEDSPAFSPDGRWVAYNSNASGRFEVYVRGFGGPAGQFQVSRDGGWAPRWRGDGKEIFFLALDGTMMAASVTFDKGLQLSVPRALFPTELLKGADRHIYAVANDGQRFLLRVPDQRQQAVPLSVVVNWPALAKK